MLLAEVAADVLAGVVTATGRWIASSAMAAHNGKAARRDADIAVWFGTYELVGDGFPGLDGVPDDVAAAWLRRNDVHAVLHELLATRITDAPEADVERLRGALRQTARDWLDVRPHDAADKVSDAFFDWADGEMCALVGRFEARDPQRWRSARTDAFNARVVAVLNAIERHLTALDADPAEIAAWIARYRRQAVRAYGSIEPPDFARRRRVPIADLYVPPDIVEPGVPRDSGGEPRVIGFDELPGRVDRTVLLGDPGGGKSTASQVITHLWAGDPTAYVPFLVVLRDFADGGLDGSVVEHIEERLNAFHQCPAPDGAVERLLLAGSAAVVFDGLDELIDTGRRVEVTRVVEQFCERFPLAPVLVTSRLVGYDEARLDDAQFDRYRIAGFGPEKTAAYVRNWFAQEDGVDDEGARRLAGAFARESEQVADLRANPLMLALMCILYRGEGSLPRNRPGVYAECAKLLFDKWDTRRGIHVDLRARNLIEPALRHIAYWLFTRDGVPEVTEGALVEQAADFLYERGFELRHDAEAAAREFVAFCRGRAWILGDAGTTARGEPLYTFTHRTFLEYFAAAHLATAHDTPEKLARALAPHVARDEWDVVGQLAVQIKDSGTDRGAERVLTALLADKRRTSPEARTHLVAFAARCLDVAEVPPALVRTVAHRAFDQLAPDATHAMTYLPLWRDGVGAVITEVIQERTAVLVASADPDDRTLGLRFSAYATFFSATSRGSGHWHRLERDLTARHRDALVAAARTDDTIWMRLIDRGTLTLAEALRPRPDGLGPLFREIPVPFAGRTWPPYVAQALFDLSGRDVYQRPDPDAAVDRCEAFGTALLGLPDPPWPVAAPDDRSQLALGQRLGDFTASPDLTPLGWLGAAAMIAVVLTDFPERADAARTVRELSGLVPLRQYLESRLGEGGDLPDLPVPARFQDLFRRWARGEIEFVQWRHDEPG
jgi:hypothetical protein